MDHMAAHGVVSRFLSMESAYIDFFFVYGERVQIWIVCV